MNAFASALAKASGASVAEVEFDAGFELLLAKFLNNGGTIEASLLRVEAICERRSAGLLAGADEACPTLPAASPPLGSEGHESVAGDVHLDGADASQPNDGAVGHDGFAGKALVSAPAASSPERNGAGHGSSAKQASEIVPRPVPPSYVETMKARAEATAKSVLDSFRLRDGRAIGDIIFGEIEMLRFENAREASVLRQVQRHAGNATANQTVREVIRPADLERMIQRAAEVADAT